MQSYMCAHHTHATHVCTSCTEIPYSMPLCPEFEAAQKRLRETREELAQLEKDTGMQTQVRTGRLHTIDSTDKSLLMFEGHEGVHGVYEIILNHRYARENSTVGHPPPCIYSPREFQYGTLKILKVKYAGQLSKSSSRNSSAREILYALDLEGPCMPLAFHRYNNLLRRSQCHVCLFF